MTAADLPDFENCKDCFGFNLRKAMRAVSQFYDDHLRPLGLKGTQFSLLVSLQMAGEITVTQLAEMIVMDRTTLTRNLEVMEKQNLVSVLPGEDRRTRMVTITGKGLSVLLEAYPLWLEAQTKIKHAMADRHSQLIGELNDLIKVTQHE